MRATATCGYILVDKIELASWSKVHSQSKSGLCEGKYAPTDTASWGWDLADVAKRHKWLPRAPRWHGQAHRTTPATCKHRIRRFGLLHAKDPISALLPTKQYVGLLRLFMLPKSGKLIGVYEGHMAPTCICSCLPRHLHHEDFSYLRTRICSTCYNKHLMAKTNLIAGHEAAQQPLLWYVPWDRRGGDS